jgi:flagellar biosynthesis protein
MKSKYRAAAGLMYDEKEETAPLISSRGEEATADKIVGIAERYGVPVIEDPKLAESLARLEEGDEIPTELFEPVAIILNGLMKAPKNR